MRRITPWAILLLTAAMLLLICPTSAEMLVDSGSVTSTGSHTYEWTAYGLSTVSGIAFYKIEDYRGLKYLYTKSSRAPSDTAPSIYTPVTLKSGSTVVGHGYVGYNKLYNENGALSGCQYWIDISDFNPGSLTGMQHIIISRNDGGQSVFGNVQFYNWGGPVAAGYPVGFGGTYPISTSLVISKVEYSWVNEIEVTDTDVSLTRIINANPYRSVFTVVSSIPAATDSSTNNVSFPYVGSGSWLVASPYGKNFTGTFGAADIPDESAQFTLSLSPTSAAVGDTVQATLTADADAPAYDMVEWTIADDWRPYRLSGSTWYAYNATTETYADAVTEADVLEQTCQFTAEGNGPVFCRVYDLANGTLLADLKEYVTVSGTSALKWPLYVAVFDADTGATLMSTTCQITNLDTSEVTTTTIQTSRAGETFLLNSSDRYQIVVSKAGYESRTWTNIRSDTSSLTAYLPKTAGGPEDIYIYFSVHDTGGAPVPNALVSLSGLTPTLTNSQGSVKLLAATNTTYTYTVTADGYLGATDTLETSATSLWYECTLTPSGGAATIPTTAIPGGSSENLDDAMAIWTDNLQLIAALLFMAFIIGILKLMV